MHINMKLPLSLSSDAILFTPPSRSSFHFQFSLHVFFLEASISSTIICVCPPYPKHEVSSCFPKLSRKFHLLHVTYAAAVSVTAVSGLSSSVLASFAVHSCVLFSLGWPALVVFFLETSCCRDAHHFPAKSCSVLVTILCSVRTSIGCCFVCFLSSAIYSSKCCLLHATFCWFPPIFSLLFVSHEFCTFLLCFSVFSVHAAVAIGWRLLACVFLYFFWLVACPIKSQKLICSAAVCTIRKQCKLSSIFSHVFQHSCSICATLVLLCASWSALLFHREVMHAFFLSSPSKLLLLCRLFHENCS